MPEYFYIYKIQKKNRRTKPLYFRILSTSQAARAILPPVPVIFVFLSKSLPDQQKIK
jgi:hypothetical protein